MGLALNDQQDPRLRIQALGVISDAYMKKQAVLGDPAQIEKAIKTVAALRSKIGNKQYDSQSDSSTSEGSESAALATQEGEFR